MDTVVLDVDGTLVDSVYTHVHAWCRAFHAIGTDATELPAIWLAIDRLWLGSQRLDGTVDPDAWKDFGFDLDNTCTLSPTCDPKRKVNACNPSGLATPADGNDCRNNTFGNMQKYVSGNATIGGRYGLDDNSFNCGLCNGNFTILIRITGYNGTPNDSNVRVDLFGSPGLDDLVGTDCNEDEGTRLCWLPEKPWKIERDNLVDQQAAFDASTSASTVADDKAFVRDSYLIAQLPASALIRFPGTIGTARTFPIKISHGIVSARIGIDSDKGLWQLSDAVIGGRVAHDDIVQGFKWVGLCEGESLYKTAIDYINANLDISSDPNAPAGSTCDARRPAPCR